MRRYIQLFRCARGDRASERVKCDETDILIALFHRPSEGPRVPLFVALSELEVLQLWRMVSQQGTLA